MSEQESRQLGILRFRFLNERTDITGNVGILVRHSARSFGSSVAAQVNSEHINLVAVEVLGKFFVSPAMLSQTVHEAHHGDWILDGPPITMKLQTIGT